MARRHLSSEEQALWSALTRSVRPLRPGRHKVDMAEPVVTVPGNRPLPPVPSRPIETRPSRSPAAILDSGWERRIRGGTLVPDMAIDLHGHTLSSAHAMLNQALSSALARGLRILLVITGKPPKTAAPNRESRRGAIRGEIVTGWKPAPLPTGSRALDRPTPAMAGTELSISYCGAKNRRAKLCH